MQLSMASLTNLWCCPLHRNLAYFRHWSVVLLVLQVSGHSKVGNLFGIDYCPQNNARFYTTYDCADFAIEILVQQNVSGCKISVHK